mmetsp:Transcript_17070/g.32295  ORF Transcript_17070/g.32295 Transcript_17070/m.32295 type:complete len:297 (-) Transcript_17070:374-1264(-)
MNEETPLSWRERCTQEFSLLSLPGEWTANNDALSNLSVSDDETWKRYHEFRTRLVREQTSRNEDDDDDDEGYGKLLQRCQEAFRDELRRLDPTGGRGVSSLDWQSHTIQQIEHCNWEDLEYDGDLRSATYLSYIFSPYALPHALNFKHYYHLRARMNWGEFHCEWLFSMLRFDGKPHGDEVQQELAYSWPMSWHYRGPSQVVYKAQEKMEVLASNGLIDPPHVEGVEWAHVEDINVSNFTSLTVQRLRGWLFGSSFHSLTVMDNFSFLASTLCILWIGWIWYGWWFYWIHMGTGIR